MLMRKVLFLAAYFGGGVGCFAFTLSVVVGLPAYLVGAIPGFLSVLLVDRVGEWFGVSPIFPRNERTDFSTEAEVQNSPR